jgi:hypothetical protein
VGEAAALALHQMPRAQLTGLMSEASAALYNVTLP